jgi:VWFA-related protein
VTPAQGLPGATPAPEDSSQGLTLRTTARLVDVDVVVYDHKGHPITDLKQSDFQIFDEGRPQTIRSFGQAATAAQLNPAAPPAPAPAVEADVQPIFSNRPAASQTSPRASTILLIDAGSLAFQDLGWARAEMLRFIKSTQPTEHVGLYILRAGGLQILSEPTADHTQLAALLTQWKPSMQDLGNAQDAEDRNRQHIDEVHKPADLYRVNGNTDAEDPDGGTQPMDPQLRDFGSNPAGDALLGLLGVARHLAPVAGHKNLVWVSSDNVLADWTGATGGNPTIQTAILRTAMRAQEAMNDAHVSVYPLDASQLEGGAITADMQHRNVELNQAAKDTASLGPAAGPPAGSSADGEDISTNRNMAPGRIKAEMQSDLHAIQPEIQQLAIATGGRALRRAGDIAHELDGIVADGRAVYMLSFSPDTQPDNQYHHLTLKITGRRDVSMRYRNGYLYALEPTTLKSRFQQALWEPADATDLTITATPLAGKDGPELRLNIAGAGLEIIQRGDRYVDQLDFFFMQSDGSGGHARIAGQSMHLDLKPGTYQEVLRDGVPFKQNLALRPNLSSLRVLVVDENSGRIGSVTIPATALE